MLMMTAAFIHQDDVTAMFNNSCSTMHYLYCYLIAHLSSCNTPITDRQKLNLFIRHSILAGTYTPHPDYDSEQLCNEADHRQFNVILKSQSHVLEQLLSPALAQTYNFRKQPHTRQIPYPCSYPTDCNFF